MDSSSKKEIEGDLSRALRIVIERFLKENDRKVDKRYVKRVITQISDEFIPLLEAEVARKQDAKSEKVSAG